MKVFQNVAIFVLTAVSVSVFVLVLDKFLIALGIKAGFVYGVNNEYTGPDWFNWF